MLWADGRHPPRTTRFYLTDRSDGMRSAYHPADGVKLSPTPCRISRIGASADGAGGFPPAGREIRRRSCTSPVSPARIPRSLGDGRADDEGGFVNVTFARSWLDTMLTLPLSAYRIWRRCRRRGLSPGRREARRRSFDDEGSGACRRPCDLRVTTDATG